MSNLWNILNEDSSTPSSNGSCDSSISLSSINNHSRTAAQSLSSRGLEKMSLDFVAPGSRSGSNRASQSPYHPAGYTHCGYSTEHNHLSLPAYGHLVQIQSSSAQHSQWALTNSTSNYARSGTIGSTKHTESESVDTSDHYSPPTDHQSSPSGSSRNGCTDTRRESRHGYGEEERAFIMVCAILRGMAWNDIEKEFRKRFPAGQKRRYQERGFWPTYPEQERTASGLTCAYYRIRCQWGIPRVRDVSDEQKPEVKDFVKKTILNMYKFPHLQNYVQQCR